MDEKAFRTQLSAFTSFYCAAASDPAVPDAVDYTAELHEALEQEENQPGYLCAIKAMKEWQELDNNGLTDASR